MFIIALSWTSFILASNYYVDKNANGNNNGTSWLNAWWSFSAINWNSIQPGDIIYISGGTDSTIYYEQLTVGKSGTAANPITIISGKYSPYPGGHNGRVIIDGGGTRSQSIYVQNKNYITLKGFECRSAIKGIHVEDNASYIIIDSMYIYNFFGQAGIMLNGADLYTIDNVTIRNCRIESCLLFAGQTDGIYIQRAQRSFIYNNYIHQRNQDPSAHTDCLQAYLANGFVIYNNFFINDSVYSPEGGGTPVILGAQGTNPVIIYNNFLYMGGIWDPSGSQNSSLWLRWYNQNPMPPTWVLNNTIVVNGPRCRATIQEYNGVMINNILAMYSTSSGMANLEENLSAAIPVDSTRGNLFWRSWADAGFSGQFTGNGHTGSVSGWTNWVSTYRGTGVHANPLFVHNFGYEPDQGALGGELQSGSPAINAGVDISSYLEYFESAYGIVLPETDIYGNLRNINNPSIGAYEYSASDTTFFLLLNVTNGWNLVSAPGINPNGQGVVNWWAGRIGYVYKFSGEFQVVTTATPGEGYWMKHVGANTYNTGDEWPAGGIQITPHNPINATTGWNLIGGYENSISASAITTNPPDLIGAPIYKFSGSYQAATTIRPGYGYWIKLTGSGQIILPGTLSKENEPNNWFPKDWGRIILQDATGINYTLYAVKGEVDLSKYELPPAPPDGMFDIRYGSGRIAEDLNSALKTIEMSGVTYPLIVRVENLDIRLQDETGKQINVKLKSGEDVVISNEMINKLLVSSEFKPNKYTLEQNYPNPFNPSTAIEFSLPEDVSNVKLSIYNALGERVAELVNTNLTAGRYSYKWNALNVSTGMYIYELRTNKFVSVKKMLLMK